LSSPGPSADDAARTISQTLPLEIEPAALSELRRGAEPYALLDVREPWELEICGFAEALHLPLGGLAGREHELPRDRPLVVVCHHGQRSLLATRHLRQRSLTRAVSLRGGVEAYALEVDPAMARY
jgi:rhodanese-related sulfurtransferase